MIKSVLHKLKYIIAIIVFVYISVILFSMKHLPVSSSNNLKDSKPHEGNNKEPIVIQMNSTISRTPSVSGQIQWTEITPNAFVLQAYLDLRLDNDHFIRILTMLRRSSASEISLGCALNHDNRSTIIDATKYEFNENHGMEFGGYIHSCRISAIDSSLSNVVLIERNSRKSIEFPLKPLRNPRSDGWKYEFSVCVPPLHGSINDKSIVAFIEMNRILGANHFHFYEYRLSDNEAKVRRVLERYASRGVATVSKWTVPSDNVWYHGQMSNIHHCLYENIGRARYVIFADLDEALVPMVHDNWALMMRTIDTGDHCGYRVPSIFMKPSADPLVYLSSVERFVNVNRFRTKCIVRPELIFEQGIHHISKQNIERFTPKTADPKLVLLFHYRPCDPMFGFQCSGIGTETRLKLLAKNLTDIYHNSYSEIFPS